MYSRRVRGTSVDFGTITAIAIDKDKNSQHAFKWAVENLLQDSPQCVLVHVQGNTGNNQDEAHQLFLPFRGFCTRKGIIAKEVILGDLDISNALVKYISNNFIANIVVGTSARNSFLKKFKSPDVPTTLLKTTPETCAVFVVSKGKLSRSKFATQPQKLSRQQNLSFLLYNSTSSISSDSERASTSPVSTQTNKPISDSYLSYSPRISPPQSVSEISHSERTDNGSYGVVSTVSSYTISSSSTNNRSSITSTSTESPLAGNVVEQQNQNLEAEVRRLRLELKQFKKDKDTINHKENSQELQVPRATATPRSEEAIELPRLLFEREKQKRESEIHAAEIAKRIAQMESLKRRLQEMQANLEKERLVNEVSYRRYSIKDVEAATNGFSDDLKIGEGGYGPVYKAVLHYNSVAIKIMKSGITEGLKQFQQEIEVLSSMRHPNMVILLGACPELGCLVYEYMENGTLEDRIFCKNDTPPLSWRARFRIAAEIATGLLFLHQAKPEPLVHRDLKPANILLDKHFTSKISDVGLARLVPPSMADDSFSNYHMTSAAGTFCYIDPEYQQTGMLGVKSDLYSFGVVLLQIITAMPAMGLTHKVEMAIENNKLREILDPKVSEWPEEETLELAKLALQCCELRKKDRPDLASVLLPALTRLREFATEDHERVQDRTYVSHVHNSVSLPQIPHPQINKKLTVAVPATHEELDPYRSSGHSISRRSRPPRSHTSQSKGKRWSFMSCAPSKVQWGDLP
ncbi:PREDICTED: U-box domain-containing protein 35-like isoform X2 [Camelina sativa]|uniref:RING-type E3 ubiquitin transferase n=1 Tax=Camelina sativa TaxID=90675 RepID=A0ABM0STU4_CAMSA|nr:PREDICTED: U-box domain-containing protein 35-like isoform X2 [Camelina sativa]